MEMMFTNRGVTPIPKRAEEESHKARRTDSFNERQNQSRGSEEGVKEGAGKRWGAGSNRGKFQMKRGTAGQFVPGGWTQRGESAEG